MFIMELLIGLGFCSFIVYLIYINIFEKKQNISDNKKIKQISKEKANVEKGKIGEDYICYLIEKNIDIYYKIIRNVYIPIDGKKTEIDILFITSFGIFVIESKNYNGSIYGSEEDFKWTEYFTDNKKYQIPNPIKQNNHHIKFLSEYLNKDLNDFKSYIVFGNNSTLSKLIYNHVKTHITKTKSLIAYLIDDMHNSEIKYSHEEIDKIYIDLKYYCEHNYYDFINN